ncbi:MAG TPA: hypothetical protein DEP66_06870, partial [Acidimicrobiaceae bacterium]|nr:hypothetical protein [Acidimicrobiaceae bacterium]
PAAPAGRPVAVGILGSGRIGRMHAALIAGRVPGLRLAAVHDQVESAAHELGSDMGVPAFAGESGVA